MTMYFVDAPCKTNVFEDLKKLAKDRKEKNKLTKAEMERINERKTPPSKGVLASIEKFSK